MIKHKMYYDNQREWKRTKSFVSTEGAIQAPFTFYYINEKDWSLSHNWDYWNINFTSAVTSVNNTATIKTIYDPAPLGFTLPKTAAFTAFTKTGEETTNSSYFNVSGTYDKGWNFYTNGWKNGNTIFFATLGYRNTYSYGNGNISGVWREGYYWAVGASSTSYGRVMDLLSDIILPQRADYRSCGFSARAVIE